MAARRGLYRNFLRYEYELGYDVQTAVENIDRAKAKDWRPHQQHWFLAEFHARLLQSSSETSTSPRYHSASRQRKVRCSQNDKEEVDRTRLRVAGSSALQFQLVAVSLSPLPARTPIISLDMKEACNKVTNKDK
ncbi:hypothetical protein KIN20_025856 [Parelaphostrongylus tenuis]|uniref:Uncharacterized protein n=1 Tax=Parelaphostrongylus tenuis TaxID=148309 RepID=A0AAD5QWU3_PARTN|nr:hypothetical protein KIN20_025856 [Parelaphostrongylus tenuis]